MPSPVSDIPRGFFDGTSQGHPSRCGVGVVIHLSATHFFQVRYAPSRGTNSKAEFSASWTLLFMANNLNVRRLQVLGDSKVVIDCVNKKLQVLVVCLESLLQQNRDFLKDSDWISFAHIYRELNAKPMSFTKKRWRWRKVPLFLSGIH